MILPRFVVSSSIASSFCTTEGSVSMGSEALQGREKEDDPPVHSNKVTIPIERKVEGETDPLHAGPDQLATVLVAHGVRSRLRVQVPVEFPVGETDPWVALLRTVSHTPAVYI